MVFQYGTFKRMKNGWQVSKEKTTIAGVFRKQISAAPGYEQLRMKDLDKKKVNIFVNSTVQQIVTKDDKIITKKEGIIMLAVFMANSGGAWDNAKKYIEGGAYGGNVRKNR